MKLAYLVYDLNDPAVRRRVLMLRAGGMAVQLIGFYRGVAPATEIEGAPVLALGETFDGRLAHRALSVVRILLQARVVIEACRSAELIMARNLEMLAIAVRVRAALGAKSRLIYECLDIHRMMLSNRLPSRILRALERWLMVRVSLLLVSSPAFVRAYFEARQRSRTPTFLVENKVLDLSQPAQPRPVPERPPGGPWRIGWFGMIRCRRSLQILIDFTDAMGGQVEVVIRGKPAYSEFTDFDAAIASARYVRFEGPYQAADLAAHYAEVHFVWTIDYFEVGLNSSWLLPNRLYEGSWYGAAPLADRAVETGAWLAAHQAGVLMTDPETEMAELFRALTAKGYQALLDKVRLIPDHDLRFDLAGCGALTGRMAGGSP